MENSVHTSLLVICLLAACARPDPRLAQASAPELKFQLQADSLLYLPEGWSATLWAESPQLYNPTNMDVDHRGRIWITEAVNYRDFNNKPGKYPHFEGGDRIVILEDTDNDGRADSSKVFVQDKDLVSPLGIAVIGNQVVVSCSPNLIVYTDEDGDDRPDKKEVLLSGFGGFDHDHSLHAVVAGPDGRWYFNTGNAGPHTVTDRSGWTLRSGSLYTGGTPYNKENSGNRKSDDGRVWIGGLALRVNPDGTGLEVLSHNFRNSYELAVDSYGDLWQNDNDDQVETCRATWLMYGSNAGYFSEDGTRYWQADRRPGQSTFTAHWHQRDPGVLPAGDNTGAGSPTGVLVYEGDAFGEMYRGMFLSVDAGRNVVFAYQPQMQGAGFALDRKDLITSVAESTEGYIWHQLPEDRRKWFRPSDMVVGTDGAFYIADWYDPVVGGHQMRDTTAYGRIYRIAPTGTRLLSPEIDLNSTDGQIAALCNPAVNIRNLGFQRLREQGSGVLPKVAELLKADNPYHRARAVWLLPGLGTEGIALVETLLREAPDPRLRVAAFRSLTQQQPEELLAYARLAAADPSPAVRRAAAVALRDVALADCQDILLELYRTYDGRDRWYLEALGIALQGKASPFYELLLPQQKADPSQWEERFATLAWRLHPPESVAAFATRAQADDLPIETRIDALTAIGFIPGTTAAEAMIRIADATDHPRIRTMARYWINFRRSNLWLDAVAWEERDKSVAVPEGIRATAEQLRQGQLKGRELIRAAQSLAAHPGGGKLLLQLASTQQLPAAVLRDSLVAQSLFAHPEQEVRLLAGKFFTPANAKILSIQRIAELQGMPAAGARLFPSKCGNCHRIGDRGQEIGPALENIRRKFDRISLADAIVHPNAAVTFGYEPYTIRTSDGQVYTGFLLSEGEATVIRDLAGTPHTIRPGDISEKQVLEISLMPTPQSLGLNEQDVADLIAFLMRAPEAG